MTTMTQMLVRLPSWIKAELKTRARANNRTVTKEVVTILENATAAKSNVEES